MGRTRILDQVKDLLYPPACLSCSGSTEKLLCAECQSHLTLLPIEGHCSKCFSPISAFLGVCKPCRKIRSPFRKVGACFDQYGPAKSLSAAYLQSGHGFLAKEIASYIAIQLDRLHFPPFETVTVVPTYLNNPLEPIGKELASLLGCHYQRLLKRSFTKEPKFILKKLLQIMNQKVLLLDLNRDDLSLLHKAGWALDKGRPELLYGMTFCATL